MAIDRRRTNSASTRQSRTARVSKPADLEAGLDFRQLLEDAAVRVIVADRDLNIIFMNAASRETLRELQNLLPCPVDEILGKSIDIFHEKPEFQRRFLSDPKNLPHSAEIRLGPEILDLNVTALLDAQGNYFGPMVTWNLITEKKAIQAREADLIAQMDALGRTNQVIQFNLDGTVITANENFLSALGYTLDEIRGKHHSIFCDEQYRQSAEYREFWAKLNRGEYVAGEFKRITKSGHAVWIQAAYNPIRDSSGKVAKVVKFSTDISAAVVARNEALRIQEQQLAAADELRSKVSQLVSVVQSIADGDLTQKVEQIGDDDMGKLAASIKRMSTDLRDLIGQLVESATQQNEGARAIAESSQNLSEGAQSQAASVEEMSASIEDLVQSIQVISEISDEARRQAESTAGLAKSGGTSVNEAISSMRLIQKSSEQINDIIQVISEIASQTNLLALNAAIEAARAGEHGLGFAVVADEVRKLAERSSLAAKEITQLIKESTRRVAEGADLSEKVGESLSSIVQAVEQTAVGIVRIADSTKTQADSAKEVQIAIRSVGKTTESNAAAAEEMAASAEELGAQATTLQELVAKFKV